MKPTKTGHGNVPWGDRNTNFRLIIYSHISTNRKNSAKIGPVDAEIITCIGLRGIVKNKKQQQNI